MAEHWTVNSDHSLAAFIKGVTDLYHKHKYITYSAPRIGADRGLTQNALSFVWYNFADKMLSEQINTTRRFCKLHFGVPILRGEDEKFLAMYNKVVLSHDYETKLEIMDYMPVTSLMSREQMTRYLNAMQVHYAQERGLVLESLGEHDKLTREAKS